MVLEISALAPSSDTKKPNLQDPKNVLGISHFTIFGKSLLVKNL